MTSKQLDKVVSILFILPAIIFFILVTLIPYAYLVRLSFSKWILTLGRAEFNGLDNFVDIFTDKTFWHSMRITLFFTCGALLAEHVLGFSAAILLKKVKCLKISKMMILVFAIPMVFPPLVTVITWRIMFNPSFGILNYFLSLVNISPQSWHHSIHLAIPSLIIVDAWQWSPFVMLVILSGLNVIPSDVMDAARIDGAFGFKMLIHITLPLIIPFILVSVLFRLIYLLTTFDLIIGLTKGGPAEASLTLYYHSYRNAFKFVHIGYGAAVSLLLFLITVGISMVIVNITRRK